MRASLAEDMFLRWCLRLELDEGQLNVSVAGSRRGRMKWMANVGGGDVGGGYEDGEIGCRSSWLRR